MFKIEVLILRVSFWRALKVQRFIWRVASNPRRQSKNVEMKCKTCIQLVREFYMVRVSSTMWRIQNQSSNSTSCSDIALRLLVLVVGRLYWGLQVTSSFSIWGCDLECCFERGIFWRTTSHLKGIEDFNLEHRLDVNWLNFVVIGCYHGIIVMLLWNCSYQRSMLPWQYQHFYI